MLKIVKGIPDVAGVSNPEMQTEVTVSCSGGRLWGRSGAEDGRVVAKLIMGKRWETETA